VSGSPADERPGGALPALADYDFALPAERIAQEPLPERDAARLLHLDRRQGAVAHASIRALPHLLRRDDLLVVNATRVLPARLRGRRDTGGAAEALLLGPAPDASDPAIAAHRAFVRISGRLRPGIKLRFFGETPAPGSATASPDEARPAGLDAEITAVGEGGEVTLTFRAGEDPYAVGWPPLPPYIERAHGPWNPASGTSPVPCDDRERYQTVFARVLGAIAAPTAGLHLSQALLAEIEAVGVRRAEVILHVGAGTFRPLREEDLRTGLLHAERFELTPETARAVAETRRRGGRVVAVGTTATRVLETCAREDGTVGAGSGETRLFLRPGDRFQVVDALLTNFHLPRSSLLLLVSAFAGRERVLDAYREAIARGYRFYSYGDAMWIA
jgi:S-adenosylmethionine:tRNA ribosyltransferase-isomerase